MAEAGGCGGRGSLGGCGPDGVYSGCVWELEAAAGGGWRDTGVRMETGRYRFGACVLEGRVVVSGGLGGDGRALESAESWAPGEAAWRAEADMEDARCGGRRRGRGMANCLRMPGRNTRRCSVQYSMQYKDALSVLARVCATSGCGGASAVEAEAVLDAVFGRGAGAVPTR